MNTKLVRSEILEDGRVQSIVLDAPKGNILSMAMIKALEAALAEHRNDPHLRLVVLQGAGPNFSFGASVEEHRREQAPAMLRTFHAFIRMLAAHPIPVAALVRGACLGGAFEVVTACHVVFCTADAKMGCPEVRLGVFPPVLAVTGPHRLGMATSERLLLTGAVLGPEEAVRCGFAARIVADEAEVHAWFRENLGPLSAYAIRQATRASREGSGLLEALDVSLTRAEQHYLEHVLPSHDGNEGVEAFIERRPARWEDR